MEYRLKSMSAWLNSDPHLYVRPNRKTRYLVDYARHKANAEVQAQWTIRCFINVLHKVTFCGSLYRDKNPLFPTNSPLTVFPWIDRIPESPQTNRKTKKGSFMALLEIPHLRLNESTESVFTMATSRKLTHFEARPFRCRGRCGSD